MSARKCTVAFTARAQNDLDDILLYTRETWGKAQRSKYRAKLQHEFDQLAMFPHKGRARNDISNGLRSISIDHYLVYYRVGTNDLLMIHRIVHSKRDIIKELDLE